MFKFIKEWRTPPETKMLNFKEKISEAFQQISDPIMKNYEDERLSGVMNILNEYNRLIMPLFWDLEDKIATLVLSKANLKLRRETTAEFEILKMPENPNKPEKLEEEYVSFFAPIEVEKYKQHTLSRIELDISVWKLNQEYLKQLKG